MSVGPESHYHAFFFALTWFLPCIKLRKSKIFSCHILCAFLIFVFSIFIYEIEHGLSNKFILINSSWLLYVEQWKKLALSLIYTDQTNQIIKWFLNESPMLLMCSISCPLQRWLDVNFSNSNRPNKVCKLHTFWNKNVTCYSSFSLLNIFI